MICLLLSFFSAFSIVSRVDASTNKSLHEASERGLLERVRELLVQGADVSAQDEMGRTPLHVASTAAVAQVLIEAGADLEAQDQYGRTPLHWASLLGYTETVKLLIAQGVNLEAQMQDKGGTPLYLASWTGHLEVVKTLIAAGVNLEFRDEYGKTSLHAASQEGDTNIVQILLEAGADTTVRDTSGRTPFQRARGVTKIAFLKHAVRKSCSKMLARLR